MPLPRKLIENRSFVVNKRMKKEYTAWITPEALSELNIRGKASGVHHDFTPEAF